MTIKIESEIRKSTIVTLVTPRRRAAGERDRLRDLVATMLDDDGEPPPFRAGRGPAAARTAGMRRTAAHAKRPILRVSVPGFPVPPRLGACDMGAMPDPAAPDALSPARQRLAEAIARHRAAADRVAVLSGALDGVKQSRIEAFVAVERTEAPLREAEADRPQALVRALVDGSAEGFRCVG